MTATAPQLNVVSPDDDMVHAVAGGSTPVDPDHFASFKDLKGRVFTLKLPYSRFLRLREELAVDFREATVMAELPRVLRDTDLLYNVVSLLVKDQLDQLGLARGYDQTDARGEEMWCWQDDMFGCETDDSEGPLEQAGRALQRVVVGFIRNPRLRQSLLKAIDKERTSLNAAIEHSVSEIDSVNPTEVADVINQAMTGGKPMLDRIKEALSSSSSGSVPDDLESSPGITPSDS